MVEGNLLQWEKRKRNNDKEKSMRDEAKQNLNGIQSSRCDGWDSLCLIYYVVVILVTFGCQVMQILCFWRGCFLYH